LLVAVAVAVGDKTLNEVAVAVLVVLLLIVKLLLLVTLDQLG
jgi:high-affinity K+ transport system ATPase subunit B